MENLENFVYKNRSSIVQTLIGFGKVLPGEKITTNTPIHNQNFILVDSGRIVNVEAPTSQPKIKNLKGTK